MKLYSQSFPKVDDIMTPRSLLHCANEREVERAQKIAARYDFDAVPLLRHGAIRKYWSREQKKPLSINREHRVLYDTPIEAVLPRLGDHMIQFVFYRSELVGLVDVSDLNKPVARLTWLRPLLECEQAIVMRTDQHGVSEEKISAALGRAAREAKDFRDRAIREDLRLPLLGFAHFRGILKAAVNLGLIELAEEELNRLNKIRNRSAHIGQPLIENKDEVKDLIWTLKACQRILQRLSAPGRTSARH